MSPHELSERLLDFGARVCKVVDALPDTRAGRHVGNQLVRCGTSPAPNYEEACAAESRADFTHKMSLCLKELRESRMWLRFIIKAELLPAQRIEPLWKEADELCNIFGQSVVTSKKPGPKSEKPNP
jgi:four helix bundle protein